MDERLGLNLHRDGWPTARSVAALEDAGLRWLQVHVPPRHVLADRGRCRRHARALCSALGGSSLAYHGLNFADAEGLARARIRERAQLEERSLRGLLQRAHTLGVTVAIENLAPVHPSPPRLCHDAHAVRDLVRRLETPAVGMLLDVGHLHITADASHADIAGVAAEIAPDVVLFHVHDNLGVRRHDLDAPGVDPLKLDLHLPPGRGCLPWGRLAGVLREHAAPLILEVELSQRPALPELAAATLRALAPEPQRAAA